MAMNGHLLFWPNLLCILVTVCGQDFSKLSYGNEGNVLIFPDGYKPDLIEKIDVFATNEETADVSEALRLLNYHQETEKSGRKRRQAVESGGYVSPMVSELHASQHCHGIYLRWKKPQVPVSSTKPFTVSEFSYYNVYRSKKYFTNVNGMAPYASGKEIYELSNFIKVGWLDRDPLTNDEVWYAVTIVTRKGKEWKNVSPTKAKFIGAFGPVGKKIALTSRGIQGRTLHHSAIYNPDRNEYFVVYDVDTNIDGQPDRIYALRITPDGAIVRNQILDVTSTGTPGSQGRPSIAYNPITNEYLIVVQVKSNLFGGKSVIAAMRLWTTSFKLVKAPQLILKGNENINGKLVQLPVVNPYLIYNPLKHGYIVMSEFISVSGRRSLVLQFLDSSLNNIRASFVFSYARSGRIVIDKKRNELYVVAQLPRIAFSKDSVPKLPFAIIVKKRTLTGDILADGEVLVKAGETRIVDSSLSCFYDIARDRLMVFWSDMVAGKRVIRSSRILIQGNLGSAESLDNFQEEICPGGNLRGLSVVTLPTTIGQLVVGEQFTKAGGFRLHGPLIKDEAFQHVSRSQRAPFLVSNERGDQILALWQEIINGRQSNVFGRILKAASHDCTRCNAPKVCKKQNTCVLPFKSKNLCSSSSGQCNQICLKSNTGVKCSCRDGFVLDSNKKTCSKQDNIIEDITIVTASLKAIWKTKVMKDRSLKIDRLFGGDSLVAVVVDEKTNLLYWSDVDQSIIFRGQLDGTKREIFISNVRSDGMHIDSEAGKVFWTDFLNKRIEVADRNKQNRISLVTSEIDKPRAITSCKKHGVTYLYWSDWGSPAKIERLQLDGSLSLVANRRKIVSNQLVWPNGLTADCDEDRLYWADAQLDKIEVSDLLGNGRRKLDKIKVFHPFSVLIYGSSIYWSDWIGTVKKADKETGLKEMEVMSGIVPRGIYIFKGQTACRDPGVPTNGYRKGDDFKMNKVVSFMCKKGYKLMGKSSIRCQNDGIWSDQVPVCVSTRCQDPIRPLNGNRNMRSNKIGGAVIYTCNPGYKLLGEKVRRCIEGGVWSGNRPICMSLPVFTVIPGNETTRHGEVAIFHCLATGAGKISLHWFKDGHMLRSTGVTGRIVVLGPRLILTKVFYSDAGKYSCQASNKAGTVQANAYLRVVTKALRECGMPKFVTRQRIFNGRNAGEGAHPWMTMFWDKSKRRPFCGASLIAKNYVLTAAHCLEAFTKDFSNIEIKFGKIKAKRKAESNEQVRNIKKIHRHPQYNDVTYDSDIAVVELDSPVDFTDYVIPICLPNDQSDFKLVVVGASAVVVGWGATKRNTKKWSKKLKEIHVPVIDQAKCKRKMSYPVTGNMFCAGTGGHADACQGDSGGPITIKNTKTKKHVLVGIVSWGLDCGNPNHHGIYVKLYNFLPWVHSIVD